MPYHDLLNRAGTVQLVIMKKLFQNLNEPLGFRLGLYSYRKRLDA